VKESVRVNTVLVLIKIGALLIIILYGSSKIDNSNYEPFFPYGPEGMFKAGAIAFFAYLGVEGIAT
jgi:APA family basic amino acid/polyamine antiporter